MTDTPTVISRTPVRKKAKQFAKLLAHENPDYNYLRELFRYLRFELEIKPGKQSTILPYVPTEEEVKRYYNVVWQSRNMQNIIIIKTLLYTGVRVSELVRILIVDVDLDRCQIRINQGKGGKFRFQNLLKKFWLFMPNLSSKKEENTYSSPRGKNLILVEASVES